LELQSDLWLDQPDAHERIDERLAGDLITPDEAARLHTFVDSGFLTFSIDLDQGFCEAFDEDVDGFWTQRPADLAVSSPSNPQGPTSFRDWDGTVKAPGYRIPDMHSHSDRALDIYLHPGLFRMVELIYGEPAIAFQSLYFEYGSQQSLHRDPMFVFTDPPAHLLASWVALEDVTDECGPLAYVPGSHRLPWFEFTPGSIVCGHQISPMTRAEFASTTDALMRERGMEVEHFTCKRGDAFIWHAGLVHGGTRISDVALTRKSFVTHYCTAANYRSRTAGMKVRDGDDWQRIRTTTERVLEREGRRGLDNPVRNR
jgi:phytanoyl-CoA hydroxylase